MKYINHMTCAHDDEKMQKLIDLHGMAGYGAYWLIAEVIASQIRKESMSTSLRLSYRSWGHRLHVDPRTASKWVRSLGETGLATVDHDSNGASVDIPNLLKYGDEYMKRIGSKSRPSPDKRGSLSHQQAVPAVPEEKKDLKDLPQPVDNSAVLPFTDRAVASGGVLEALPAAALSRGENGNGIHPQVKALNLTPEKERALDGLYRRHQVEHINGNDVSEALRFIGLSQFEIVKVASLFIG